MPPYTSTELYDALLAHAGTLKDKASADKLAKGLREFSGMARTMAAGGVGGEGLTLVTVEAAAVVGEAGEKVPVLLTTLLPTPYSIILPLLLLLSGLVLCFAGTFLTLDRTRRVPEHKKPGSRELFAAIGLRGEEEGKGSRWTWESTGGVGGMVGGWLAGGQLATSLTLLILNQASLSALSGVAFFIVWLVVSILFAVVGLRFRFAAFAFLALLGSHSLTLLLLQTFRLSTLLARLLPYPLFLLPLLLAFLTPYPAIQHHSLRFSTSFSGAFAITLALSLLTKHDWAEGEVLLFFAGDAGLDWKSGSWKGFCAMGWLIALAGYGVDALLKGKLGENPDETWSSYLSDYASRGLPTSTPRQGTFTPHLSPWSRLLALNKPSHHPHSPLSNEKDDTNFTSLPTKRRVATDASIVEEPLKLAKFRPSGDDDSDSDDEDEKGDLGGQFGGMLSAMEEKERNWSFPSSTSNKGTTVKFSTSPYANANINSKYDPSTITSARPSFATQDSQRTLVGQPRGPRRRESDGKVGSLIKRYDSISSLSSVQQSSSSSPPERKTSLASVDSNSNSNYTPSSTTSVPNNSNWTPASRFNTTSPPPLSPTHNNASPSSFASPFQPAYPSTPPQPIQTRQLPLTPSAPEENTPSPSLVQAYDRIARSQQEARLERMNSYQARRTAEREREEEEERETKGEWEEFWEEVKRKSGGNLSGEGR